MAEYVMAKYIRLSIEDAKTESMSIENQRALLDGHIAGLDIPGATALEFVDNGHTGTNFERPGMQELIEQVRAGKINCILIKDFSRFGRNSIEAGYLIERVFPLYGVRFISVSDCYDSDNHIGDTGGVDVAFKFMVHEYYSRDLSMKIKTAKREKMRRGEYVTKNCGYGYMLDEGRRMVIDRAAAENVRLIFKLALEGKSLAQIAGRLYEGKQPAPSEYRKLLKNPAQTECNCIWNKSVILQILRNEQYTGTYIAGITKNSDVGGKCRVKADKSEWITIPGHHPAIIEQSLFDAVCERINQKGEPLRGRKMGTQQRYAHLAGFPLKGKVYCGGCNHKMTLSNTKNARFHCAYTRSAAGAECHRLSISAGEFSEMLYEVISKQAQVVFGAGHICDARQIDVRNARRAEYDKQIGALNDEKRRIYERFVLGEIDAAGYKAAKLKIDREVSRLELAKSALLAEVANLEQQRENENERKKIAGCLSAEKELTRPLVDLLINKVLIYPNNKIVIDWKVAAFFDSEASAAQLGNAV